MSERDKPEPLSVRLTPRREFLRDSALAVVATGAVAAGGLTLEQRYARAQDASPEAANPIPEGADTASPTPAEPALTDVEVRTLRAAVDRIFPSDEYGPSGTECGVDVYIQNSLQGWLSGTTPLYVTGLASLDAAAGGDGFAALGAVDQDAILTELEAGTLTDAPEGFWGVLLEHSRQGMFSDPMYGGNKDFAGWDLINYPGIKLIWTAEDQATNTEVKPEHLSVVTFGGTA